MEYKFLKEEEQYYYYARILASAKMLRDENPIKSEQAAPDIIPPEEKSYNFWIDFYEFDSKSLNKNDSISIEAQIQNYLIKPSCEGKWSKARKRFRWKNGRCPQLEVFITI